jgi:membrane protease subunit HflK
LVRNAEIYRSDLLGRARGSAESFVKLAEEEARSPEVTRRRLWLERMERVLPQTNTIVVQPSTGSERRRIFIDG